MTETLFSNWLEELFRIEMLSGSPVVIGPVPQILPAEAPSWLRTGKFLDLPTYADGASMSHGYSGNCLLNIRFLETSRVRFDQTLNYAGGEDMLFSRQIRNAKGRLSFAAHATAVEPVPAERCSAWYVIRLNFRRGNTLAICDRKAGKTVAIRYLRGAKATARIVIGALKLVPMGIMRGKAGIMLALCEIAHGAGGVSGLGGHVFHAYVRVDSPTS